MEKYKLDIDEYLEKQTKEQLISLIKAIASQHREVEEMLRDEAYLSIGEVDRLVSSIRERINGLMPIRSWEQGWDDDFGSEEDYSEVRKRLNMLLDGGHSEFLPGLGKDIIEAGIRVIEESNDEGQTGYEITDCLEIVMKALSRSGKSILDQMLWVVEAELLDEYDLMPDTKDFWAEHRDASDWGALADVLLSRLNSAGLGNGNIPAFSEDKRDYVTDRIILALEMSNRLSEIIPLCKEEALRTCSYERLVQRLIMAEQLNEAEEWLKKGIIDANSRKPYIASILYEILCEVEERKEDWIFLASLRGDDFLAQSNSQSFSRLLDASAKAGIQQEVRVAAMHYLETGHILRKEDKSQKEHGEPFWPLPETGLAVKEKFGAKPFPRVEVLMDIAIDEKKPPEILRWYELCTKEKNFFSTFNYENRDSRVADAISLSYPDKAISIWKGMSERLIAETKPASYEKAATYLWKIRNLLNIFGRNEEWDQYMKRIKASNHRKVRLMQILETISDKKVIET